MIRLLQGYTNDIQVFNRVVRRVLKDWIAGDLFAPSLLSGQDLGVGLRI